VLDEPMSALDVTARQEMRRLVSRRCAEEGLTLLLVTHDVLDLTALAEEVVVLDRGRVVEQGPTAQVLAAPRSDFVARLTGTSVLTGVIDGKAGAPGLRLPSGRVIHGRPQDGSTEAADRGELLSPGAPGVALVPPDAVALYREAPEGSPRNVLTGRVTGLERSGALVSVRLELEEGQRLSAAVTAGAVAELGIAEGRQVCCVIKAVQVRVVARRA
ncbi:TOBE domain protein, partial [Actinomyces johnsonii F0542]